MLNSELLRRCWGSLVITTALLLTSACGQNKVIDRATFQISPDMETIRLALVFDPRIHAFISGEFLLKDYGSVFMSPYVSDAQPFELGVSVNTSIINDQDYVHLQPTLLLPNGVPIGIDHPIVEIRGQQPISPDFDLFAYVDITQGRWFGAATMFSFMNDQNFPVGMALSAVFMPDTNGQPGIIAYVYGPSVNSDGSLARAGGVALFGDVRRLVTASVAAGGAPISVKPEKQLRILGPDVDRYKNNPSLLEKLQKKFIEGMNQLH